MIDSGKKSANRKSKSREELLRQWKERRAQQQQDEQQEQNLKPHIIRKPSPKPSTTKKVVKVRVRRSHPTPEIHQNSAVRLYQQGTVASRLKAKPPTSTNVTTFAPKLRQYPSTLPRARHEQSLSYSHREEDDDPIDFNHPRMSDYSSSLSPPPDSPLSNEDSTKFFIVANEREDAESPLSPLSCSVRSSIFESPTLSDKLPLPPPRRPSRCFSYQHDSLPPKDILDEDHGNMGGFTRHSMPPGEDIINKYSTARLHTSGEDDDDLEDDSDDNGMDKYRVIAQDEEELETSRFENVTGRTRCKRSMSRGDSFSSSLSDHLMSYWEDRSHWSTPSGIMLPASPSQRRREESSIEEQEQPKKDAKVESKNEKTLPRDYDKENVGNSQISDGSYDAVSADTDGGDVVADLSDDDSFDWKDNLSFDLPSQRLSTRDSSKRRREAQILALPPPEFTNADIWRDFSPKHETRVSQRPSPSSLKLVEKETEQHRDNETHHYRTSLLLDPSYSIDSSAKLEEESDELDEEAEVELEEHAEVDSQTETPLQMMASGGDEDIDEDYSFTLNVDTETNVQVNGKTILRPIRECSPPISAEAPRQERSCCDCRRCSAKQLLMQNLRHQVAELQWRAELSETENQKYRNQIYAMRKRYESRITPFRDLFEEMASLRKQNVKLQNESDQTKATLQSSVAQLQRQMTEALNMALSRKSQLEARLQEAESTVAELQCELDLRSNKEGDQQSCPKEEASA